MAKKLFSILSMCKIFQAQKRRRIPFVTWGNRPFVYQLILLEI